MPLTKFTKIDYVIVYDSNDTGNNVERFVFEQALTKTGLKISRETIGMDVYILIHCPFERLAFEAETVKLEMNLKGCVILKPVSKFLAKITNYFQTDDEIDMVSGGFERAKFQLYDGSDNEDSFFRTSLRSLLVHHILINLNFEEDKKLSEKHKKMFSMAAFSSTELNATKKGLPHLLMKGVYKDAFILHDQSIEDPVYVKMKHDFPTQYDALMKTLKTYHDPRKILNNTWMKFYKFQPLWKIRNYFGEQVAFYFAWEGVYVSLLWPPAIFGLASFMYGFYNSFHSDDFEDCQCVCDHTRKPPLSNYTCSSEHRSNSTVDHLFNTIEKTFNNDLNPYLALFICFWGTLFLEIWKRKNSTLAYEWDVQNFENTEPDRPQFFGVTTRIDPITKEIIWDYPFNLKFRRLMLSVLTVFGMMFLVLLTNTSIILLQVFMRVSWNCVDVVSVPNCDYVCEENRAHGNSTICFMMTTILPSLVNALLVIFWEFVYSKVAMKLTEYENHQTQTDFNDALILKLFAFQFVNSYAYLAYIAIFRPDDHAMEQNGIFNMGPEYKDTCRAGRCMSYLSVQILLLMITKPVLRAANEVVLPWLTNKWKKVFNNFQNKTFLEKVTYIKSNEAFGNIYLERERNKPPVGDFSLEAFSGKVIQFGYVLMFTVSFPLAPVIALVVSLIDLRMDGHRLLWFNRRPVAFQASDIGTWQPIMLFVNFCGVISNSFLVATFSDFSKKLSLADRLFVMLGFEHIVFLLIYICQIVIPDVPSRVKQAMRKERYQVNKILAEGFIPRNPNITVVNEARRQSLTCVMENQNGNLQNRNYREVDNCIYASQV